MEADRSGPWASLPRALGAELRRETAVGIEIVGEIRKNVPEFSGTLSGDFGAQIRDGVENALEVFAELVGGSAVLSREQLAPYRRLGRAQLADGRSLDALQSAYRIGARVAWRRHARVARRLGLGADVLVVLAEAIFAYIDELASASARGFAAAQAEAAGELEQQRQRLLDLLLSAPEPDPSALAAGAAAAGWAVPRRLAAVTIGPGAAPSEAAAAPPVPVLRRDLPRGVLGRLAAVGTWLAVPEALLTDPRLGRLMRERGAVVGPLVPPRRTADSLRWARLLREALPAGAVARCDDHLGDLFVLADRRLSALTAARRLAPLDALTPKQAARARETLRAWLASEHRSAPEVAALLAIHPQTARLRLSQLHRLLGPALDDPAARLELQLALAARNLTDR